MAQPLNTQPYKTIPITSASFGRVLNDQEASFERIITKQNTAVNIGDLLYNDGTGFVQATPTIVGAATKRWKFYVAVEACPATTSTAYYIRAVRGPKAIVAIPATMIGGTGTLNTGVRGMRVAVSATAGKCVLSTLPTTVATLMCEIGTLHGDTACGDAGFWVVLD
jgi:hypothetical protein